MTMFRQKSSFFSFFKAKLRERTLKELLYAYQQHLREIVQRHGGDVTKLTEQKTINLREICDYYIKLDSKWR